MIHPVLSFYAGGEYLCLNVCEALLEMGYRVSLACDVFRPSDFDKIYGMGSIIEKCDHIQIPEFRPHLPRFIVPQRLSYAKRIWPMFRDTDADIVFSTQSSPFVIPQRIFHFVYNVADVFGYPPAAAPLHLLRSSNGPRRLYHIALRQSSNLLWKKWPHPSDWFFAIGSKVLDDLKQRGFRNSSFAFPPCRVDFKPVLPKKKQVVQAARMIPEKRLELYLDISSRLPEYRFYLVGRDTPLLRKLYPGYSERLLSRLPRNVTYVDALVRERPELLEESKVYVYTGVEQGIGLALVEAIAAGCIPFCPPDVGAADVVRASGVGHVYNTAEEAAAKIKASLEQEFDDDQFLGISERAKRFGPDVFKKWISMVVRSFGTLPMKDLDTSI